MMRTYNSAFGCIGDLDLDLPYGQL